MPSAFAHAAPALALVPAFSAPWRNELVWVWLPSSLLAAVSFSLRSLRGGRLSAEDG